MSEFQKEIVPIPSQGMDLPESVTSFQNFQKNEMQGSSSIFFSNRRYDQNNLENGRNFFKFRYINRNLLKKEKERRFHSKSVYKRLGEIPKINNNISVINRIENDDNDCKIIDEEKELRKFNSIFLKKVEKVIFNFNLKYYQESYNVLQTNEIVDNKVEFGEFLLVINGFDKNIIGDFLAKQKPPNENGEILKSFMKTINFKEKDFLDAFRFLFTRINLPKDSNLILNIIGEFSNVFFEDNINMYPSSDAIFSLASTVLALNTMFTRKDIKAMIKISKEKFQEMNNGIEENTTGKIYEDLQNKPIELNSNYNELIYRRLSQIVLEKPSPTFVIGKEPNSRKERGSFSLPSNITNFSDEDRRLLLAGDTFLKYSVNSKPQHRWVFLSPDERQIIWKKSSNCLTPPKCIDINTISDIFLGISSNDVFVNSNIPFEKEITCFSIQTSYKQSLNLCHENQETVLNWYRALKGLLYVNKKMNENKKKNKNKKLNDLLTELWKDEIVPNWSYYRRFCKVKGFKSEETTSKNEITLLSVVEKVKDKVESGTSTKYLSKCEFFFIYNFGIPKWARNKIWFTIIGNNCGISENLFNYYLSKLEKVHFNDIDYDKNKQQEFSLDYTLNQTIIDILKAKTYFLDEILNNNIDPNSIMKDLFKIVRIFKSYRPDILYNKCIIFIAMIFLLNGEDYYNSFINLVNMILPSFLLNFFLRDEEFIKNYETFFNQLLRTNLPKIESHFSKFEITSSLYFVKWFESLFVKVFKYETLLRIWDKFFLKGECVLFQVAIAIIKVQEKDIINLPISEILKRLKKFDETKYSTEELFKAIDSFDIESKFIQWKNENELAKEKGLLFKLYMDELV